MKRALTLGIAGLVLCVSVWQGIPARTNLALAGPAATPPAPLLEGATPQAAALACNVPVPVSPVGRVRQMISGQFSWTGSCYQYYAECEPGPLSSGWKFDPSWNAGQLSQGDKQWRVKGKTSGGIETAWSAWQPFTVVAESPRNLTAQGRSCSEIWLQWDPPIGGDWNYYAIHLGDFTATTDPDHNAYLAQGYLMPNSEYTFYVTAGWSVYESDPSNYAAASTRPGRSDVDGDCMTDIGVYRSGEWWILKSTTGNTSYIHRSAWGGSGYVPVWGDYDSDGKSDMAVYQTTTGEWWILESELNWSTYFHYTGWGGTGYTAVPGDFDGDSWADLAVYGGATGEWWIHPMKPYPPDPAPIHIMGWGGVGYIPVSGDFDGDGHTDIAVYGRSTGDWWIKKSSENFATYIYRAGWGGPGYTPVSGDFDWDGKTDLAVYGDGQWWILKSSDNYSSYIFRGGWGGTGYTAVPGDFDGDGKCDIAVYGASGGQWWILKSSDNYSSYIYRPGWGGAGYSPL